VTHEMPFNEAKTLADCTDSLSARAGLAGLSAEGCEIYAHSYSSIVKPPLGSPQ